MKRSTIVEIIAALLIFLFVYTGVSKMNEMQRFQTVLSQSPLIGNKAVFLSWFLPITELIVSLLLFFPRTRFSGLIGSFGLMLAFTLYISYMLVYTPHLPCSCGGVLRQMSWKQHFFFNIGFTIISLAGIWLHNKTTNRNINPMYAAL